MFGFIFGRNKRVSDDKTSINVAEVAKDPRGHGAVVLEPNEFTGVILDERDDEQRSKEDIVFEETVSAGSVAVVEWVEKSIKEWRQFPILDQLISNACVAFTKAKMLGIIAFLKFGEYVKFSPKHIYQRRVNKPSGGMIAVDANNITEKGVTLEVLAPSEGRSDREMDSEEIPNYAIEVGEVFKAGKAIVLPAGNFETVASTIQKTKKGVMAWFYATRKEWTANLDADNDFSIPEIIIDAQTPADLRVFRHSTTVVDAFVFKGEEYLLVEDSAHFGGVTRRLISREFFEKRNFYADYNMSFVFDSEYDERPTHTFTKTLQWSAVVDYDKEVVALQDCLKHDGSFPKNIESTGYYGNITADAVMKFQTKWKVADMQELNELQGRRVGGKTIDMLNRLYSGKN